jgi:hypothetical protein
MRLEKLFRELPRDTEIVVLFKRISDARVIARPDRELCGAALRCERKAAEQLVEAIKER